MTNNLIPFAMAIEDMTNEWNDQAKKNVDKEAEKIKSRIASSNSIYGPIIGSSDINSMIVAAYIFGRRDEKEEIKTKTKGHSKRLDRTTQKG
jgi:hypothetical protein